MSVARSCSLVLALSLAADAQAGTLTHGEGAMALAASVYATADVTGNTTSSTTSVTMGKTFHPDLYRRYYSASATYRNLFESRTDDAWLVDGYDSAESVYYPGMDAFALGSVYVDGMAALSQTTTTGGTVGVGAWMRADLEATWYDAEAARAAGSTAYPPPAAYRVAAPVKVGFSMETTTIFTFTTDADGVLTLTRGDGEPTAKANFAGGWWTLDVDAPTEIPLAAGDHTLTIVSADLVTESTADGILSWGRSEGVDVTWAVTFAPDADDDGVADEDDNCPDDANADQADDDDDGAGDACDVCPLDPLDDDDGDGVCGDEDVCPDGDDTADVDGDATPDECDACPLDADNDADGDGVCADADICAAGDDADDADADATPDACDACPEDFDNDVDGDGICGDIDNCPGVANSNQSDLDGDATGDACEPDSDDDGLVDDLDNCPTVANADQDDSDGDGAGDACDADDDGDGVDEAVDACPDTALGAVADSSGCSLDQLVPCDAPWKNHGAYVSALAKATKRFEDARLLTSTERAAILAAGASSDCGR